MNKLNNKFQILIRDKYILLLLFIINFGFSFVDIKSVGFIYNRSHYIFRLMNQQFFLVFIMVVIVSRIFNEKSMELLECYLRLYIGDLKKEIRSNYVIVVIFTVSTFVLGQCLFVMINFLSTGTIFLDLAIVNIIIVSLEIVISILLTMSLRLAFKKNIYVYGIYFSILMISLVINDVFLSMPLTIKILEGQSYYYSFNIELWLGRLWILLLLIMINEYFLRKFIRKFE